MKRNIFISTLIFLTCANSFAQPCENERRAYEEAKAQRESWERLSSCTVASSGVGGIIGGLFGTIGGIIGMGVPALVVQNFHKIELERESHFRACEQIQAARLREIEAAIAEQQRAEAHLRAIAERKNQCIEQYDNIYNSNVQEVYEIHNEKIATAIANYIKSGANPNKPKIKAKIDEITLHWQKRIDFMVGQFRDWRNEKVKECD